MKSALILAMAVAICSPAHAGGPVIIEEAEVAPAHDRKVPAWVFLALGAVVVAAIAGNSDNCNGDDPVTPPNDGGC